MPPGQIHQFVELNDFKGYNLAFSADFLNNLSPSVKNFVKQEAFSIQRGASVCHIKECVTVRLRNRCDEIMHRIENPVIEVLQKDYLASLLSLLLFDIIVYGNWESSCDCNPNNIEHKVYVDFLECVENNFTTMHVAKDYVGMVDVSLSSLNKYVITASGKTPARIICERIAIEAKRMLYEHPEWRIKEISSRLGFEDSSNFIKFFKRYTGMTPIDFREMD